MRLVLAKPDAVLPVRTGRIVAQRKLDMDVPTRPFMIRVIIDVDRTPPEIVTAYRTSRMNRYEGQQ